MFIQDARGLGESNGEFDRFTADGKDGYDTIEWLAGQDSKPRHLTRLYNERPTWLDLAHRELDAAVFAAYGWKPDLTDDDLLAALLALNLKHTTEIGLAGETKNPVDKY